MEKYSFKNAVNLAQQHNMIHQYTKYDALEKIVNNHSLRLTRLDLVNDSVENEALIELWKNRIFVSCFTHLDHESYFFWHTYSEGSSDGVMLSFDRSLLKNLRFYPDDICKDEPLDYCKRADANIQFSPDIDTNKWGIYDYSLIDVFYLSRDKSENDFENHLGRFKFNEWDMEKETRIRVALKPKCFEAKLEGTDIIYLKPKNKYIYAELPDNILETMIITLSPFSNDELQQKIEALLYKNCLYGKSMIRSSTLKGEIEQKK